MRALCVCCMHSRRLPRHPVSCLSLFLFFSPVFVFLVCVRGTPRIQHVTGKRAATSWIHPIQYLVYTAETPGVVLLKKLLRIISTPLWFFSKSLKYLRIYPTFHEYLKEPKASLRTSSNFHSPEIATDGFLVTRIFEKRNNVTFKRRPLVSFVFFGLEVRRCNTVRGDREERSFSCCLSDLLLILAKPTASPSGTFNSFFSPPPKRKYLVFCE